jgi:hypothetical protein
MTPPDRLKAWIRLEDGAEDDALCDGLELCNREEACGVCVSHHSSCFFGWLRERDGSCSFVRLFVSIFGVMDGIWRSTSSGVVSEDW